MFADFFFSVGVLLAVSSWGTAPCWTVDAKPPQAPNAAAANKAALKLMVPLDFCTGSGGCDEYISRVQLGGIDEASACAGYEDHSGLWTVVMPGQRYSLVVTNGNPIYSDDYCSAWVDWNNDETWSEDEQCGVVSGTGPYQFAITVPLDAASGYVRLRVRIDWDNPTPQPCGATDFGEVEDYSLLVASDPLSGACCDLLSGTCTDEAPSSECQSVGQQFHPDMACDALVPPCGNPGACCSDVLAACDADVPELSCAGTRFGPGLDCAELDPPCGEQQVTFEFDPGTGPPPATACGLSMTPFDPDPRPLFDYVTTIPTPCPGSAVIDSSIPLSHRRIGAGWLWWSHGYTGDVYYTHLQDEVTLALPTGACALYFYVEPNSYSLETFQLTINELVESEAFSVSGAAAAYVGICGADLQTIRLTCTSGADFAIGEFGISCFCGVELCACCHETEQQCEEDVELSACLEDPDARFILGGTCVQLSPPCGELQGACCYGDECQVQRPSDCTGEYIGDGSVCRPNPCRCADLVVDAPGTWSGSTCGMHNHCDMSSTPEVFYEVHIPHFGLWRIDLCDSSLQAELEFGETCCDTFGYEQGACDDQPYLEHVLSAGTYFVTIEGWTECGAYSLEISELEWGACCDSETAECLDFALPESCYGAHTRHELCADLDPPCTGPPGACCDDSTATCVETSLASCDGRFAALTACVDLSPTCGRWQSCTHRVELYDSYGDGWTGNTLDLYVRGSPVLVGMTLADGFGPEVHYFEAAQGDEIRTVFNAYGQWPEEAYYVIVSGQGTVLAQDGDGTVAPTGLLIAGGCPEPCGDLDQDYDVDLGDYDLFFDILGECRSDSTYSERADLDQDGCVTEDDFALWLECYLQYAD